MTADSKRQRQLAHFPDYSGDVNGVQWSPDGKRLVFAITFASFSDPPDGRALYVINADGTGQRQLTPWSLGAHGIPDWSAKTNRIAFRAVEDEEAGKGNFFTIGPDGKDLTQVTHFTDTVISHRVGFSPDGKWITFGKAATNGANDVFTIKVDGTDLQPVTHAPEADTSPDWAPTS